MLAAGRGAAARLGAIGERFQHHLREPLRVARRHQPSRSVGQHDVGQPADRARDRRTAGGERLHRAAAVLGERRVHGEIEVGVDRGTSSRTPVKLSASPQDCAARARRRCS